MTRVLVTGGTGALGRETVTALRTLGVHVRILSRAASSNAPSDIEWAVADYTTGAGLREALRGVDTVVHAAHDGVRALRGDQDGLRRLLDAVDTSGGPHFVYVSIVGARDVPGMRYYAAKARAEDLVLAGGRPASIFRATQFHHFLDDLLRGLDAWPIPIVPRHVKFQPVYVTEAGEALARHALNPAPVTEFAGPAVHDLADLLRARDAARGVHRGIWTIPAPLPALRAVAAGRLTSAPAQRGQQTWQAWLSAREQHAGPLQFPARSSVPPHQP